MENKNKLGAGQCNGGNCPNGGKPGTQPGGNTVNPNQNAADSVIMGGSGNSIDEKKLRQYAEEWASLPARSGPRSSRISPATCPRSTADDRRVLQGAQPRPRLQG